MTMIISGTGGATFPDSTTQTTAVSTATPFAVTGNSTAGAEIRLPEDTDNGSNYVALKAANSIASNVTFTLPDADGTSGQVIQTNGSGTLSFATPSSGAMVFLASATASNSASVTFTNIGSTYDTYMIIMTKLKPANDGEPFYFRTSTNNGSSYDAGASEYIYTANVIDNLSTNSLSESSGANEIKISGASTVGNAATENGLNGYIYIYKPSDAQYCQISYRVCFSGISGQICQAVGVGQRTASADVDAIQIRTDAGNITSGTIRLYGIVKS